MSERVFMWNSRKRSFKQHIQGPDGRSRCLVETHSKRGKFVLSPTPDKSRKLCRICLHLEAEQKQATPKAKQFGKVDHFLLSREWKELRYRALRIADGKCCCCGARAQDGARLNVDHIKSRVKYPELALTLGNLQVLCSECNQGKGWKDETDWREPDLKVLMGEKIS